MKSLFALLVLLSLMACKTTKDQAPDTLKEPVAEVELEEEEAYTNDAWTAD
jgi:hypothetical protein